MYYLKDKVIVINQNLNSLIKVQVLININVNLSFYKHQLEIDEIT